MNLKNEGLSLSIYWCYYCYSSIKQGANISQYISNLLPVGCINDSPDQVNKVILKGIAQRLVETARAGLI